MSEKNEKNENCRRSFLKKSLALGIGTVGCNGVFSSCSKKKTDEPDNKVKALTTDGKLVEVNSTQFQYVSPEEARKGIPNMKFVMVIDLSRCRNARKCISKCQDMHFLPPEDEWIKVFLMRDSDDTAPYWFPKPCFHCNQPPCVKVCPIGATYKRSDGIVLIDNKRCIGCKFCMAACPYSSRVFQWKEPEYDEETEKKVYSPETSVPALVGTVGKCDFCPDMARKGKLPNCVTGCPNGVIFFGNKNEDIVSNGTETVRFSELVNDRAGYHYMAELGTEPNVYYLPPVNRLFDYEDGLKELTEEQKEFYLNSIVKKE
ncbi:MAG: 4Fe-4S dicluster domain-containing protein [Bacteroidetes bacterium]|nr:4Fe-4S dicluster domain-containing protein [Bacteroidota bacterium]